MHNQHVINLFVNARHRGLAHSLSRFECVCAYIPSKHVHVLLGTFSHYVQWQDIVLAISNYNDDRASNGFVHVLDVMHKGRSINFIVSEMQGSGTMVPAQYMPFE